MKLPQDRAASLPDRRVLVVGLGSMGGAMARTLVREGWEVFGFDPSADAAARAEKGGISTLHDLSNVAGIPYAVLSLPGAAVVSVTVDKLLGARDLKVIVDASTSDPQTSRRLAATAPKSGVHFVDAPVSGGPSGAATGQLSAFVGADDQAWKAAAPILESLTHGKARRIGPPGAGNIVKLLNNAVCASQLMAVGEALDIAAANQIDLSVVTDALTSASAGSKVTRDMYPSWILSGTFDAGFGLSLMARDVSLAIEVAGQSGSSPKLLILARNMWNEAKETLGPSADFTEAPAIVSRGIKALLSAGEDTSGVR